MEDLEREQGLRILNRWRSVYGDGTDREESRQKNGNSLGLSESAWLVGVTFSRIVCFYWQPSVIHLFDKSGTKHKHVHVTTVTHMFLTTTDRDGIEKKYDQACQLVGKVFRQYLKAVTYCQAKKDSDTTTRNGMNVTKQHDQAELKESTTRQGK